jgi:DNA topoisomerase-1
LLGGKPKDEFLPKLTPDECLKPKSFKLEEHETEPPPRYTEASLIKALETKGVGRPSTYAPMISTLYERKYVIKRNRVLKPTELGMLVYEILIPRFPKLFEVKFTAEMEKELDQIENGEKDWRELLEAFYSWFSPLVERVASEVKEIKRQTVQEREDTCPLCGSPLVEKWGRFGKFVACSNWPTCKYSKPLEEEIREDVSCPLCGKAMVVRRGKGGRFLACIDYPQCRGTRPLGTGVPCPECKEGELVERQSKRGKVFFSCSRFPECDYIIPYPPVGESCPSCNFPILMITPRGNRLCPKCKKRFKRKGPRGG